MGCWFVLVFNTIAFMNNILMSALCYKLHLLDICEMKIVIIIYILF